MNAQEAVTRIRELLGLKLTAEKFAKTKLADGLTEVTNNKDTDLALGDALYVVMEDGTLTPAPAGEHVTREGIKVYVDAESNIYSLENIVVEEAVEAIQDEKEDMMSSAVLADGTKVETDSPGEFAVGEKLYVVTEDGTRSTAPEGEHTTQSGITLVVDGEGIITGVKYPDETGEGSLEEMKNEMKKMREAMSSVLSLVNDLNGKFKSEINGLKNEVQEFKNAPDREPVLKKFSATKSDLLDWKLELLRNSARK
jgi:hypothetical protein